MVVNIPYMEHMSIAGGYSYAICSMQLWYIYLHRLGDFEYFYGANVGQSSSTMEHMGMGECMKGT